MPDRNFTENPSDQSPWSRPVVLISGAFLLVLILAGILVAFTGADQHQDHSTPCSADHPAARRDDRRRGQPRRVHAGGRVAVDSVGQPPSRNALGQRRLDAGSPSSRPVRAPAQLGTV